MARLYVCNYGPSGNLIGAPIYSAGQQCSSCPAGFSCSKAFPGLCSQSSSPVTVGGKPVESENEISNQPITMNGFRPMIQPTTSEQEETTESFPNSRPTSSQPLILSQDSSSSSTKPFNPSPVSPPPRPMTNFSPSRPLITASSIPARPSPQQSGPTFQSFPSPRPRPSTFPSPRPRPSTFPSPRPRPSTPCTSFLCLLTRPGALIMDSIHQAMDAVNSGFRFP